MGWFISAGKSLKFGAKQGGKTSCVRALAFFFEVGSAGDRRARTEPNKPKKTIAIEVAVIEMRTHRPTYDDASLLLPTLKATSSLRPPRTPPSR